MGSVNPPPPDNSNNKNEGKGVGKGAAAFVSQIGVSRKAVSGFWRAQVGGVQLVHGIVFGLQCPPNNNNNKKGGRVPDKGLPAHSPHPRGLLEGEGALGANSERLQSGWGAL